MSYKKWGMLALTCCLGFVLSGCYTVLNDPFAVQTLHEKAEQDRGYEQRTAREDAAADDDFYRYPGVPGSYGSYGAGYPIRGYTSGGYGRYGAYPLPYGAYSSYGNYGYGPYSYGYDPYYTDNRGFYVPPGYELVSTRELDNLRTSSVGGRGEQSSTVDQAAAVREEMKRQEDVWIRRASPQVRRPDPTPRSRTSIATPSAPTPSATRPSATSSSAAPASKTSSGKERATPQKRRR